MRSGAHEGLIAPLKMGISGINKSSSDDRPGPDICGNKYVEDAKAARSVRVRGIETGHHQMPAGVGGQWQPCGDGKPAGPDVPT